MAALIKLGLHRKLGPGHPEILVLFRQCLVHFLILMSLVCVILPSRAAIISTHFRDKDDVLRKASLLRGSNIHVTEDMNRKTRESRAELRR